VGSLIILRHGESEWNAQNRFTGWADVSLTERGIAEAKESARRIKAAGITIDIVYTSVLTRCLQSVYYVLLELDRLWIPVEKSWRLNERHYGALQGLNKKESEEIFGAPQIMKWRRGFFDRPPLLDPTDARNPSGDPRYASVPPPLLPRAESLSDTLDRVTRVWEQEIAVNLRQGKNVLVLSHGNTLRALRKNLEGLDEQRVADLSIPTGVPFMYAEPLEPAPAQGTYLNFRNGN
jgi:2,3-bisphosphoglycerate-dependent phosphoglycerate mutase